MSQIGTSVRRKACWIDSGIDSISCCPECGGDLVEEHHTFLVGGYVDEELQTYFMSNRGAFCKVCPVAILSKDTFDFSMLAGNSGIEDYHVAGMINMDAIPDDERDIPLGTGDTPIPLMEFIKDTPKVSHKTGRNSPCPCGSGKKYKKCCVLTEA